MRRLMCKYGDPYDKKFSGHDAGRARDAECLVCTLWLVKAAAF